MPKETSKKQENKKSKKEQRQFGKDFKAELKKVIWPTPKQLLNNTVAVITVVLITAAIVFVLDFAFESINTYGIDKLKDVVESKESTSSNEVSDETSNEVSEEEANDSSENQADTTENVAEESTNEGSNSTNTENSEE